MILVTLGTQDKSFKRLLEAIDKAIEKGAIKDKVVVQAGYTKYTSENMEIFDYLDRDKFEELLGTCDLLITHGGVGTIMSGLQHGKVILAAARLKQYHEHTNDHQVQLLESFDEQGYVIYVKDLDKLDTYLAKATTFKPKALVSNASNMIKLIEDFIDKE